jgi:hypothetical protein
MMLSKLKKFYHVAKENKGIAAAACGLTCGVGLVGYKSWTAQQDVHEFRQNALLWCELTDEQLKKLRNNYWELCNDYCELRDEYRMNFCELERSCEAEVKKILENSDRRVQEAKTAAEKEAAKKYQELLCEAKKNMEAAGRKKEEDEVTAPDASAGRA